MIVAGIVGYQKLDPFEQDPHKNAIKFAEIGDFDRAYKILDSELRTLTDEGSLSKWTQANADVARVCTSLAFKKFKGDVDSMRLLPNPSNPSAEDLKALLDRVSYLMLMDLEKDYERELSSYLNLITERADARVKVLTAEKQDIEDKLKRLMEATQKELQDEINAERRAKYEELTIKILVEKYKLALLTIRVANCVSDTYITALNSAHAELVSAGIVSAIPAGDKPDEVLSEMYARCTAFVQQSVNASATLEALAALREKIKKNTPTVLQPKLMDFVDGRKGHAKK